LLAVGVPGGDIPVERNAADQGGDCGEWDCPRFAVGGEQRSPAGIELAEFAGRDHAQVEIIVAHGEAGAHGRAAGGHFYQSTKP